MKSIVVESGKNGAVLLREDGVFEAVHQPGLTVGQRWERTAPLTVLRARRLNRIIAACLAMILLLSGGAMACYTPYTYIKIGQDNSVVLTLNVFDQVIAASGEDDETRSVAGVLVSDGILYQSAGDALNRTLDRFAPAQGGQSGQESSAVPISVGSRSVRHAGALVDSIGHQDHPHRVEVRGDGPRPGAPGGPFGQEDHGPPPDGGNAPPPNGAPRGALPA